MLAPQVPTEWFEPFRAKIKETMPAFTRVPDGSHPWWYSARLNMWLEGVDGDAMAAWAAVMPVPGSPYGKRVVTSHGDFHSGNLVRNQVPRALLPLVHAFARADLPWQS